MHSDSGALAIVGKAGCGKSVLAKTIQEGVCHHWGQPRQSGDNRDLLVSDWFYCRRRGDIFTAYSSLLRNVLSQLLLKSKSLFRRYKLLHRQKLAARSQTWANDELEQIMENITTSDLSILMIFDAIDEAEDDRIVSFVENLVSKPESSIKAILLSRPTEALETPFWETQKVTLQDENSQDIHILVQHGLSKLLSIMNGQYKESESELPVRVVPNGPIKFKTHAALRQTSHSSPQPAAAPFTSRRLGKSLDLDVLGKSIRERAGGVILWVVLVFDAMFKFAKREPLITLEGFMLCIAELPRDINALYSQMVMDLTDTMSDPALRTARKALIWINTASQFRAFTMEELWDALAASSVELDDSDSGSSRRSLIGGRIEIQSWKDYSRILRRLCGSLIEILPLKSATSTAGPERYTDVDSQTISGKCVVQLMHQTVKDFLKLPEAGVFQFSETSAQSESLHGCQIFMRSALPDEIDSIIPLPRDRPQDWVFFSAEMARYLEELRLFPLCLQLFNAFPESTGALKAQLDMKWHGLLPQWLHDIHDLDLIQGWKYDPAELTLTSSALGVMFQFIARRGLRDAARNLLSILAMGSTVDFWPRYRDVILNALAFTVFDLEDSRAKSELRARLLASRDDRTKSASLAFANRYHETAICDDLINDQESVVSVPLEVAVETMELIMDSEAIRPWTRLETFEEYQQRVSQLSHAPIHEWGPVPLFLNLRIPHRYL